ncbi:ribosomal protein S18 acetylase RimI-like enzyme [Microbacterium phyllosphaerae]|uniref:Ribosomal protein S18 acetylase RimI-like enzyme n=1 Tax=Microbacterium phyllosphaerae TaxID=124798 RepID=A0ABS4WRH0_9MICO|nr:GNAT family N-acetyltransferase [Microbacterium phyllosphaerae]MBP2378751.1 ribosomal protein S18 acetylase RimI-like enzyme [Microbacterium phyllosphaerae]
MTSPHLHSSSDELRLSIRVRQSRWDEADTTAVSALVRTYLLQTESEKHEYGRAEPPASIMALPPRYEREVADPRASYADCTTLLAMIEQRPVGVVIIRIDGGEAEIKRLWADPDLRGRGLGSALLDAALALTAGRVRLSVWDWRAPAIGLYESRGFERVASWDDREGLVCMVRPDQTLPLR